MAKQKKKAAKKKIKGMNPILRNLLVLISTVAASAIFSILAVLGSKLVNLLVASEIFRPFTWTTVAVVCAIVFGIVEMVILRSTSARRIKRNKGEDEEEAKE